MLGIFLGRPFRQQEIIVAAGPAAGIFAANGRPRGVNRAAPRLGVEEAADAAEMLIRLAPHRIGLVGLDLGEFLARVFERQAEMVGQPLDIALLERNDGIGAAIARTFRAIIDRQGESPVLDPQP